MNEFEMLRAERRAFFCTNKLWHELTMQAGDTRSVSSFVRAAILEKLIREQPKREAYFRSLMSTK